MMEICFSTCVPWSMRVKLGFSVNKHLTIFLRFKLLRQSTYILLNFIMEMHVNYELAHGNSVYQGFLREANI